MRLSVRNYCWILLLTIVALVAMVIGCSKSVVIDMATVRSIGDTSEYVPRRRSSDTTQVADTARVPISFDVSVDDWGDEHTESL